MDLNFAKIRTISIHLDIIDLFNILDLNEPITILQSEKSHSAQKRRKLDFRKSFIFVNADRASPVTVVANKSICISSFLAQLSLFYIILSIKFSIKSTSR